jgi:hypothetical protein
MKRRGIPAALNREFSEETCIEKWQNCAAGIERFCSLSLGEKAGERV